MSFIETFTGNNWEEKVLQSTQLVLVDFQAPWCRDVFLKEMVRDGFDAFMEEWGLMVRMGTLDVSHDPGIAIQFRVQEIPTLVLFDGGKPLKSFTGVMRLRDMFEHVFTLSGLKEIGVLSE